jgi:hypothetical protein
VERDARIGPSGADDRAGPLLLAMLEGDELTAIDVERHAVAWRRSVGESGPLLMTADDQAVYIATAARPQSAVICFQTVDDSGSASSQVS